jgi:hypothetical protein
MRYLEELFPRWIKYGLPNPLWLQHSDLVKSFVDASKLQKVAPGSLPMFELQNPIQGKPPLWPRPFPGGIRIPHLHFDGEVYTLTADQWKDFSSKVVRDLKDKIAKVNTVSFSQVLDLAEGVAELG